MDREALLRKHNKMEYPTLHRILLIAGKAYTVNDEQGGIDAELEKLGLTRDGFRVGKPDTPPDTWRNQAIPYGAIDSEKSLWYVGQAVAESYSQDRIKEGQKYTFKADPKLAKTALSEVREHIPDARFLVLTEFPGEN